MRKLILAALLALAPGAAFAAACTVTGTAAVCIAAKTTAPYRTVTIALDIAATQNIGCTDDGSAPTIGNAGTYTIVPGQDRHWGDANTMYVGPFTCIAVSGSQPVTYTAQ